MCVYVWLLSYLSIYIYINYMQLPQNEWEANEKPTTRMYIPLLGFSFGWLAFCCCFCFDCCCCRWGCCCCFWADGCCLASMPGSLQLCFFFPPTVVHSSLGVRGCAGPAKKSFFNYTYIVMFLFVCSVCVFVCFVCLLACFWLPCFVCVCSV